MIIKHKKKRNKKGIGAPAPSQETTTATPLIIIPTTTMEPSPLNVAYRYTNIGLTQEQLKDPQVQEWLRKQFDQMADDMEERINKK